MALSSINNYFKVIAHDIAVIKRNPDGNQNLRNARIGLLAMRVIGGLMVLSAAASFISYAALSAGALTKLAYLVNSIFSAILGHDLLQAAYNLDRRMPSDATDGLIQQVFAGISSAAAEVEDKAYEARYHQAFFVRDTIAFSAFAERLPEPAPAAV